MKLEAREVGLISAALALIADQGSKLFMLYGADFVHMPPGSSVPVLPFFNMVMVWNPGISYGLFPASGWSEPHPQRRAARRRSDEAAAA